MTQVIKHKVLYKLLFALLGFSAIVTEIATLVEREKFVPINFFSFFTIQSNILVVVVLLLSAILVSMGKGGKINALRGATTVYILIVGIGFSFLLSGLENVALTAVPWDNIVLHYIIPIAVLVDYVIDRPGSRLRFTKSLLWLIYPVAYLVYSLVRGAIVGWYPYPFLNPSHGSTASMVITILGMMGLGILLVWVITKLSGRHKRS